MQTEVAEAFEPTAPGRGGSSAMPQKQNPVACAVALEAAVRIPPLVSTLMAALPSAHERDLGGWQAEWDALPEIMLLAAGALAAMIEAMEGLHVDAGRMRRNLDATGGLIMAEALTMALTPAVGKRHARELVEIACRRARDHHEPLRAVAAQDATIAEHLTPEMLDRLFDPEAQTGLAPVLVARVLAAHRALE
jgi:3-carboxy-cis,cis-muconate cycloisomerase